jgi:hypothetical protein
VLDRLVGSPALVLDQTEQMKGLRMTRVDIEYLPAHPLRLRGASTSVMSKGRVEPSGDRRGGAA